MTEDEAKTKWCPYAIYPFAGGMSANRGFDSHSSEDKVKCIGSACMAWRIGLSLTISGDNQEIGTKPHGFCGLAGRP